MSRAGSHSLDYLVLGIVIMLAVLLTIMAVCKVCKVIQTFFCTPNYYFDERPASECIKAGVAGGGQSRATAPPTSLQWEHQVVRKEEYGATTVPTPTTPGAASYTPSYTTRRSSTHSTTPYGGRTVLRTFRLRSPWSALRMWWRRRTLYRYTKNTPGGMLPTTVHRSRSLGDLHLTGCDLAETPTGGPGGSTSNLVGCNGQSIQCYLSNVDLQRTAHV